MTQSKIPSHDPVAVLREALKEARRAIGDHYSPNDCYATGPMTGDALRDLVQCPACSAIALYDEAIAATADVAEARAERAATQPAGEVVAYMQRHVKAWETSDERKYGEWELKWSKASDDMMYNCANWKGGLIPGEYERIVLVASPISEDSGNAELHDALIELANTQHKLIEANAEIAAFQLLNQAPAAPSVTEGDALPPLPKGERELIELHQPTAYTTHVCTSARYTADQMRAYAKAAIAADRATSTTSGSVLTADQILAAERRSNMSNDEALRFGRTVESMVLRAAPAPASLVCVREDHGICDYDGESTAAQREAATPQVLGDYYRRCAELLVREASSNSVVITVTATPRQPLAMGNFDLVIDVREARERAQEGGAA